MPTDNEIADKMRVPVGLLPELKIQMQGVASLDTPFSRRLQFDTFRYHTSRF